MTQKERFIRTLQFKPVDHVPVMEIALWQQTRERWEEEGMPANTPTGLMYGNDYFGLEGYDTVHINAIGPVPSIPEATLEETDTYVVFIDGMGRKHKALKTGTVGGMRMSMDQYLEFPVRDPASFSEFKKRYEGPVSERYPKNWLDIAQRLQTSTKPLTLLDPLSGTFGYYSMLRNWMGTEGVSYIFYDYPKLIEECLEFLTDFALRVLKPALEKVKFDFYYIHEDMCFKNGPLVSPDLFRKYFAKHYKTFIGFLRSHGVKVILVDTDGNHDVLTDIFLETGVDGFGPIERAADMDPVAIRKKYGKRVAMVGAVDKREIAKGRKAIDRELDTTVRPILDQGGFIPTIDHAVPPDVSFSDFQYYLERKRAIIMGKG